MKKEIAHGIAHEKSPVYDGGFFMCSGDCFCCAANGDTVNSILREALDKYLEEKKA